MTHLIVSSRLQLAMTHALFAMLFMPVATSCSSAASDSSTDMSDVVLSDDMGMSAEVDMSDAVACEQTSHFPSSLEPHPANSRYADPVLKTWCTEDLLMVQSNGIVDYEYVAVTPNGLEAKDYLWEIPRTPIMLDTPAEIPLLGPVGVAINGIPFYGPNEGSQPMAYGDPVYNSILDECFGHTAQSKDYHYHALLVECLTQDTPVEEPSPIIGYAFDGHAIYGSRGCKDADCTEVVSYRSGWTQSGNPETYAWDNNSFEADDDSLTLDRCNGHTGPDGTYHYHATDTFPYILGCYNGEFREQNVDTPEGGMMDGGDMMSSPPLCRSDIDCEVACPFEKGCTCASAMNDEMRCIPRCETTADCPAMTPTGQTLACVDNICRPMR